MERLLHMGTFYKFLLQNTKGFIELLKFLFFLQPICLSLLA